MLGYAGIGWDILGICSDILGYVGIYWDILGFAAIYWGMLAYAGIHPFDMEFHVNPNDPRFDMESMSIFDMEFHVKV